MDLDPPEEQAALNEIERLHNEGLIKRVTTQISRIEERRTTEPGKRVRLEAGWNDVSVVQPSPVVQGFSYLDYGARGFIANPIMSEIDESLVAQLVSIGVGLDDSRAIAYAVGENAKCDYFATHDMKDLHQFKARIESLLPQIHIVKPTEFIAEWTAQQDLPVRPQP